MALLRLIYLTYWGYNFRKPEIPSNHRTVRYLYLQRCQVIADYLKPFCSDNDYIIRKTQEFPNLLQRQDPSFPYEEYVPYDLISLFTNVSIQETIDYISDKIHVKNKLPKICSKLIFRRLLLKLTTENTFMFTSDFYKQTDGCAMGGPFSVYDQNRTWSCQSIQT